MLRFTLITWFLLFLASCRFEEHFQKIISSKNQEKSPEVPSKTSAKAPASPQAPKKDSSVCAPDPLKVLMKSEEEKIFIAMGYILGESIRKLELTDRELIALYQGLTASAKGKKVELDFSHYQSKIPDMFRLRMETLSKKQYEMGQEYLNNFLLNLEAKKSSSGLAQLVLKEGVGKTPGLEDIVEIHFHGTLVNGVVYDSTLETKRPKFVPVKSGPKGWVEALQSMKEGGKSKFVLPPDLAYGKEGLSPHIPPDAFLVLEIELLKVMNSQETDKK